MASQEETGEGDHGGGILTAKDKRRPLSERRVGEGIWDSTPWGKGWMGESLAMSSHLP